MEETKEFNHTEQEQKQKHEQEIVYIYRKNETKKQLKWLLLIVAWILFMASIICLGYLLNAVVNLEQFKDLLSLSSEDISEDIKKEIALFIIKNIMIIISLFGVSLVCFKLSDFVKILSKE